MPQQRFDDLPAALSPNNVFRGRRSWRMIASISRLGIAARLAAAFISVAALVLATNFTVEQGVRVERTTEITHTVSVPVAAPVVVMKPVEQPLPPRVVTSEKLIASIDRFERAVLDRAEDNSDRKSLEYDRCSDELSHASAAFVSSVYSLSGKSFTKIANDVKSYEGHGKALIDAADGRRTALAEHTSQIEALNSRIKASLDAAWKIFGRVVARQSLMQLSTALDRLRQDSASLGSVPGAQNEDTIAAVLKDEQSFIDIFESNAQSFRRSEGDRWYGVMHDYIQQLVAARESAVQLTQTLQSLSTEFSTQRTGLSTSIPAKVEGPAPRIVSKAVAVSTPATATSATSGSVGQESIAPVIETHSVTTAVPQDKKRRERFALVSAGVLLLLFYICVATVLSIVRPVRRLIHASAQLAKGDNEVLVARGGMKELDALAQAFNSMAEQLTTAKAMAAEYRKGLEAKVAERTYQLQQLAENDPLTGLPNRRELFALLNAAIQGARANDDLLGVFFLDVDNFKYINDSMGHAFGDRVLISLARRLRETSAAFGFAARLGGDEFTVVSQHAKSVDEIRLTGLSIVEAFQAPLTVDGREIIVSVSVGASVHPDHELTAEALLKAADAALFRAKALGRNQLSMFTRELLEEAASKFTIEQNLRRSIERGEFELLFQPEINVETLETELVEALVRWRMPDGVLASPNQFLAIAEESGLIMEISEWVTEAAISAAAHWHHGAWPDARVAINVSPRQLLDPEFVSKLQALLHAYDLPARCIEIELTETVLQTGPATLDALERLRACGIAIALDDFGTGYSSLASIEQLPLSRIKLDRSLIASIDTSARSAAIARAIISMCEGLGLSITAEGVERPSQFSMLLGHRNMYLQGFLFARPVARDELLPVMANVAQRCQDLLLQQDPQRIASEGPASAAIVEEPVSFQAF